MVNTKPYLLRNIYTLQRNETYFTSPNILRTFYAYNQISLYKLTGQTEKLQKASE